MVDYVFLLIEGFFEAWLIFLENIGVVNFTIGDIDLFTLILVLISLKHGLLKKSSEAEALLSIGLNLIVRLLVSAHLDVLFQLLNVPIFDLTFELHLSILTLELLD